MSAASKLWVRSRGLKVDQDYSWLGPDGSTASLAELAPHLPEEVLIGAETVACIGGIGPKGAPGLYIASLPMKDGRTDFAGRPIRADLLVLGQPTAEWSDLVKVAMSHPQLLNLDAEITLDSHRPPGFVVHLRLENLFNSVAGMGVGRAEEASIQERQQRAGQTSRDQFLADLRRRLARGGRVSPGQILLVVSDYVTDEWCASHDPWRVVSAHVTPGDGPLVPKQLPAGRRLSLPVMLAASVIAVITIIMVVVALL